MTTHAIGTSEAPSAPRHAGAPLAVRYLDLIVLAIAGPVFALAGFPLLGYAVAAAAWLAQRGLQIVFHRRAEASDDPRTVTGLLTASMLSRGWLVALSIFGVGMAEREAGLSAAVLSIVLFTVYFSAQMVVRPLEQGGRRR